MRWIFRVLVGFSSVQLSLSLRTLDVRVQALPKNLIPAADGYIKSGIPAHSQ